MNHLKTLFEKAQRQETFLHGFELILNQAYGSTKDRVGHGRVFLGLETDQSLALLKHVQERSVRLMRHEWGRPTLVIRDPDKHELFFWIPETEWEGVPSDLPVIDYMKEPETGV